MICTGRDAKMDISISLGSELSVMTLKSLTLEGISCQARLVVLEWDSTVDPLETLYMENGSFCETLFSELHNHLEHHLKQ